ncbi:glycosyltransferase family 2 protein [Xylariaceae sp. AK1471]|nr:glycosyltransferase family 2 protein [Xylariaceae sp. AK1471]
MSGAELFLIEALLWEFFERRLSRKYIEQYQPFPLPSEEARLHNVSDVSIVVTTVSWDNSFLRALTSMLANSPGEIIVVTTDSEKERAHSILRSDPIQVTVANTDTQLKFLTIPSPNKRDQLIVGINECKGNIIALVDDDAFWNPHTLLHLLAPFQEPDVGLVGGPIESYIPEERKDPGVITPWEVAALWNRSKCRGGNKAFYVADSSTNFTVSSATMLLRAEIVKDPVFQREFAEETFAGKRQDTGDDAFITRWVMFQHLRDERQGVPRWRFGMQFTPEATVSTSLMTDSRFTRQMKGWLRTGLRFRIACLFYEPGLRNFWRTTPYMCRKMAEDMYNPLLTLLWYVAFFETLQTRPLLAMLITMWYLYGLFGGIMAFAREFPYCRSQIWAAVIADRVSLVSDWYCWFTLDEEDCNLRRGAGDDGEKDDGWKVPYSFKILSTQKFTEILTYRLLKNLLERTLIRR